MQRFKVTAELWMFQIVCKYIPRSDYQFYVSFFGVYQLFKLENHLRQFWPPVERFFTNIVVWSQPTFLDFSQMYTRQERNKNRAQCYDNSFMNYWLATTLFLYFTDKELIHRARNPLFLVSVNLIRHTMNLRSWKSSERKNSSKFKKIFFFLFLYNKMSLLLHDFDSFWYFNLFLNFKWSKNKSQRKSKSIPRV